MIITVSGRRRHFAEPLGAPRRQRGAVHLEDGDIDVGDVQLFLGSRTRRSLRFAYRRSTVDINRLQRVDRHIESIENLLTEPRMGRRRIDPRGSRRRLLRMGTGRPRTLLPLSPTSLLVTGPFRPHHHVLFIRLGLIRHCNDQLSILMETFSKSQIIAVFLSIGPTSRPFLWDNVE